MRRFICSGALPLALILFVSAPAPAAPPPTPDELTESAAVRWYPFAAGGNAAVFDDASRKQVGANALRFETDGCFDTWILTPDTQDAAWDLLSANTGGLAFWLYTENPDEPFQGPSPWIRFYTTSGDYLELTPNRDFCNDARGQWIYVTVPLNGNADWVRHEIGEPNLAQINFFEIHADTWACTFKYWIDGLTFDVPFAPPEALSAVAGNSRVALTWKPWNDVLGQFHHYAIYRSAAPFTDVTGMTPLATQTGLANTSFTDLTAQNGVHYHYAVTAVFTSGGQTHAVQSVGPRTPRSENDLQVAYLSRTPRYPRYWPDYTFYEVTEPSGFGPYYFTAATSLGGGQTAQTQRWPNLGDPVTYTAHIRNRGTNAWVGTIAGTWRLDGAVVSNPSQAVNLPPGGTATFARVVPWDGQLHDIAFTLDVTDARPGNNTRSIQTKSVPFLTYVDTSFIEDFRERSTPNYPLAATDDMLDWLQRHADEMNAMFAEQGGHKRVHYDLLEVLADADPNPPIDTAPFAIFPFRYYGQQWGDPRSPGYYHADVDIDYGLCHEMSHQLGLIDIYRLDMSAALNQVSGLGYSATPCLMLGCSPFYSTNSVLGMEHWLDKAHGYYGQYLYWLPENVQIRVVGRDGRPVTGATVKMYQKCERPGLGEVITPQVKAQGTTDASGVWTLPNVPIDENLVPETFAGDRLRANPFGYVAVVGTNGLLHFKIDYLGLTDYAWLEITEVNNAYFQGQTLTATIDRPIDAWGGTQYYPLPDLTEQNVENWTGWAQFIPTGVQLTDDTGTKHNGAASLKLVSTGYADNYVRYPVGLRAAWDLAAATSLRFWAYTSTLYSFQNNSPKVRIGDANGYYEWRPSTNVLNNARGQWAEFVVPLAGSAAWTRTVSGTPSLAAASFLEIHADPTGNGFTLWFDGVRFDPQPARPGDLNCDAQVNFDDIDPFVLALSGQAVYEAQYPQCPYLHADCNHDGLVDFDDIDPFVAVLAGG